MSFYIHVDSNGNMTKVSCCDEFGTSDYTDKWYCLLCKGEMERTNIPVEIHEKISSGLKDDPQWFVGMGSNQWEAFCFDSCYDMALFLDKISFKPESVEE